MYETHRLLPGDPLGGDEEATFEKKAVLEVV